VADNEQNQTEEMEVDLDQEVYPGGPTRNMIQEWKESWGEIYATNFGSDEDPDYYFWRTLTRMEFKNMVRDQAKADPLYKEERLIERCVIWPRLDQTYIYGSKAGIPSVLSDEIMARSGFTPTEESRRVEDLF
jgi:hypothetical protein